MIFTWPFIQCTKLGMTYTDDTRIASSNAHTSPQTSSVWGQVVGNWAHSQTTGTQGPHYKIWKFRSLGYRTVGSMWHLHGLNIQMNLAHPIAWSQPELTKVLPSSIFPIDLCQKHNSSLTGPWIYLSNRFSTLPKLYECPRDMSFPNPIKPKSKTQIMKSDMP